MGKSPDAVTVVEIFDAIKDPRVARTRLHPLWSILMLCLCAVICADLPLFTGPFVMTVWHGSG